MLSAQLATLLLAVSSSGADVVLLDFRADWCSHCREMDPAIGQLTAAGYPVRQVNVDQEQALAAKYHVSGIPCFVLVSHGQEVQRVEGATSVANLQGMFRRAGFSPGGQVAATRRSGLSEPVIDLGTPAKADAPKAAVFPAVVSDAPLATSVGAGRTPPIVPASLTGETPIAGAAATAPNQPTPLSIAVCARLRIADAKGNSVGSGTIIDARQGEALILTCGHIFRDSDGKGQISVDLFGSGAPKKAPGRLVSCDLERDVALVSVKTTATLTAAHVAPETSHVKAGDRVITIGCSHGEDPTVQESRVNSVDRFVGAANIQVAGQPVQGRSGGGLFNAAGEVIGVCNAANPTDNEGLFAALASVYKELDRAGLTFVYRPQSQPAAAPTSMIAGSGPAAASEPPPASAPPVPKDFPTLPDRMPAAALNGSGSPIQGAENNQPRSLSSDELATISSLRDKARSAEVICIVRSGADPQAKSEIIVIDKATPDLIQQLTGESRGGAMNSGFMPAPPGRKLTSLESPR